MKSRKSLVLLVLASFAFGGAAGTLAAAERKHPTLDAALEHLEKAKELLRKPEEKLKPHRELAAKLVDQAINETHHAMDEAD